MGSFADVLAPGCKTRQTTSAYHITISGLDGTGKESYLLCLQGHDVRLWGLGQGSHNTRSIIWQREVPEYL